MALTIECIGLVFSAVPMVFLIAVQGQGDGRVQLSPPALTLALVSVVVAFAVLMFAAILAFVGRSETEGRFVSIGLIAAAGMVNVLALAMTMAIFGVDLGAHSVALTWFALTALLCFHDAVQRVVRAGQRTVEPRRGVS